MSLHKPTVFTGAATALITPFSGGEIDYKALSRIIERQISSGIDALLVAGTTGEGATLSFREHGELIAAAKECIGDRVPLLAGCGSNCTSRAASLARIACEAGADALLCVTPYYNKFNDRSILLHYREIAAAASRPIILYNVPSRTGMSLSLQNYRELAKLEGVVAVKEASRDLSLLEGVVSECGGDLDVYTGNDDQITAAMKLGARGVISVTSNLVPRKMADLLHRLQAGEDKKAAAIARRLRPLMADLFREVNPIPVKYLASHLGLCSLEYRLPLCPPSPELCRVLEGHLAGLE